MHDAPDEIKLTQEEAAQLKNRILCCTLSKSDQKIILGLISFNFWLQDRLNKAKLSIKRLKKIFGFSTEKKVLRISDNTKQLKHRGTASRRFFSQTTHSAA